MERTKRRIASHELHALLASAFDRIKPIRCHECTMPEPRLLPPMASGGPNWWVGELRDCEHGCGRFIGWLWHHYSGQYELEHESACA